MNQLICPKCKEKLNIENNSYRCINSHCYDISKEGYVNLLISNKNGSLIGDNRDMASSRRDFLNKGYFSSLAYALEEEINKLNNPEPIVLDICCGEGYYSSYLREKCNGDFYGFDISKEMIRLAAKRKSGVKYFVSNMTDIPIDDNSVDFAFQLFAPFYEKEFYRILKPGGILITAIPGAKHLFSLKEILYDTPYINDEALPEISKLNLILQRRILNEIELKSNEEILSLFKMTPYYYHTDTSNKSRLDNINHMKTQTDFLINIYSK